MKRAGLAATIKARWICEQAHQQLKEKLGLDHFEGRSWQGLHRHALMTMIAYAFLQHRHLTQVGRKKESTDRRLSLACRPYATPSSISFFDHYLSNAHTAEDEAVKNSGVGKSAKVVLICVAGSRLQWTRNDATNPKLSGLSYRCTFWFAIGCPDLRIQNNSSGCARAEPTHQVLTVGQRSSQSRKHGAANYLLLPP